MDDHRRAIAVAALLAPLAAFPAEPSEKARARVERASVIVVGTLLSAHELRADDVDYGRGLLRVEEVIYPEDLEAETLLLRWRNSAESWIGRTDPKLFGAGTPALWLLAEEADGAVAMLDEESAISLRQIERMETFLAGLWPLIGGSYDEKVLALEESIGAATLEQPSLGALSADEPTFGERFAFLLKDYEPLRPSKAIAIAVASNGRYVYGYTSELASAELAQSVALLECSQRAREHKIDSDCQLYAIDDEVLW